MTRGGVQIRIDFEGIRTLLSKRAARGLDKTAGITAARAKHYAPVRKIFSVKKAGGGRRSAIGGLSRDFMQGQGLDQEVRDHKEMRTFARGRPRMRRINVKNVPWSNDGPYDASSNSAFPLFRFKNQDGERVRAAGDFRRFDSTTGKLAERGHNAYQRNPLSSRSGSDVDPNQFLSARGAYEVRSGRAQHRGSKNADDARPIAKRKRESFGRIGGRLRDEIYVIPARVGGTGLVAYVVSPTPYAVYQEYGTRHHRAQPFMRPALYEARGRFRADVEASLKYGGRGFSKVAS